MHPDLLVGSQLCYCLHHPRIKQRPGWELNPRCPCFAGRHLATWIPGHKSEPGEGVAPSLVPYQGTVLLLYDPGIERERGIAPPSSGWQPVALLLSYSRDFSCHYTIYTNREQATASSWVLCTDTSSLPCNQCPHLAQCGVGNTQGGTHHYY